MLNIVHKNIADGRWASSSFAFKMGNIGSEISRALLRKKQGDVAGSQKSLEMALELIYLTIESAKSKAELRESLMLKELLADIYFGSKEYNVTLDNLNDYCFQFALKERAKSN